MYFLFEFGTADCFLQTCMGEDDYKFATAESNSFEQLKTSSEGGGGEFRSQAYIQNSPATCSGQLI